MNSNRRTAHADANHSLSPKPSVRYFDTDVYVSHGLMKVFDRTTLPVTAVVLKR